MIFNSVTSKLYDNLTVLPVYYRRRYTEWQSMPYKEKSQYDEFTKINLLAGLAGIPKILIDEAHHCHKKISEMKTFRGCNRDGSSSLRWALAWFFDYQAQAAAFCGDAL